MSYARSLFLKDLRPVWRYEVVFTTKAGRYLTHSGKCHAEDEARAKVTAEAELREGDWWAREIAEIIEIKIEPKGAKYYRVPIAGSVES